jgi:hypothetical protein
VTNVNRFSEPDNNGLPSRRAVVRTLGTAVLASGALASACHAQTAHPDAALLRLGAEFERLHSAWRPFHVEVNRLVRQFETEWDKTGLPIDDANFAAWGKLRTDMGVEAAAEAEMKALDIIDAVTTKIRETPAKTFAGLAVKARALRFDTSLDLQDDRLPKDQDWPERVMNEFIAELDRLAKAEA